ncbi:hypothetical protein NXT3_CH02916 [Sinorhizobium fredii]|uniref:Uncharacterized protein n=1 Tax=Rhizobium fredii TaxID=380 RepID=A0A2L0H7K7_RHIFR|nr:hypothetical protein NXT3_CH02916 [Sinorhizobium fredii]
MICQRAPALPPPHLASQQTSKPDGLSTGQCVFLSEKDRTPAMIELCMAGWRDLLLA